MNLDLTSEELRKNGLISTGKHLPYNPDLIARAQSMRILPTIAESILWRSVLSKRQLAGLKFVRQRVIGHYIADFYCSKLRIVVEVDGSYHCTRKEYDENRESNFSAFNIVCVRVSNSEVEKNLEAVRDKLSRAASDRAIELNVNLKL